MRPRVSAPRFTRPAVPVAHLHRAYQLCQEDRVSPPRRDSLHALTQVDGVDAHIDLVGAKTDVDGAMRQFSELMGEMICAVKRPLRAGWFRRLSPGRA